MHYLQLEFALIISVKRILCATSKMSYWICHCEKFWNLMLTHHWICWWTKGLWVKVTSGKFLQTTKDLTEWQNEHERSWWKQSWRSQLKKKTLVKKMPKFKSMRNQKVCFIDYKFISQRMWLLMFILFHKQASTSGQTYFGQSYLIIWKWDLQKCAWWFDTRQAI